MWWAQERTGPGQALANTEDAVSRGVFGSPSFFVGDELFFGKDRLREVEEEIARQQGPRDREVFEAPTRQQKKEN